MDSADADWGRVAGLGRWDELGRLIDECFFASLLKDAPAVRAALSAPPESWFRENPRYLNARALVDTARRPFGIADERASSVFERWVSSQATPATRDVLGVISDQVHRLLALGRFSDADRLVDTMWSAIDTGQDTRGFTDVLPVVFVVAGIVRVLARGPADSLWLFEEAHRWTLGWTVHPMEEHVSNYLAVVYALSGDYRQASANITDWAGTRRAQPGTMAYPHESAGILAKALIALGALDEAAVTPLLPLVDEIADKPGDLWWAAVHVRARFALYWGDVRLAAAELERWLASRRTLSKPRSFVGQILRADLADLYHAAGELAAAEHVLGTPGLEGAHGVTLAPRMRAELLQGTPQKALSHFDEAMTARRLRAGTPALWLALSASAEHMRGQEFGAGRVKQIASTIGNTHAFNALVELPPDMQGALLSVIPGSTIEVPRPFPAPRARALTPREREVLNALRDHLTANEIAAVLQVSPNTVKTQLRTLYAKLGAHTRAEALRAATRAGE